MNKHLIILSSLLIFCSCFRNTETESNCTLVENQTFQTVKTFLNESYAYNSWHLNAGDNGKGDLDIYAGIKTI